MILLAFGTRPEYLKIKPLIKEFDKQEIDYKLLFTGQHTDLLKDVEVDQQIKIKESGNRLNAVVSSIVTNVIWTNVDAALVQGDTSSVLAVALSAFHNQIPVIHLEAGLRTYDKQNPYPEETNRRIVSAIADYHLCPTENSRTNLMVERVEGKYAIVGNTALDNLLEWKDKVDHQTNTVLVTLHRRENHHWMDEWFKTLNAIAEKHDYINFVLPIHPNPNVQKHRDLLTAKNIDVVNPLQHKDLLEILVKSRLVITDSGGIQEEASFFGKKCLTCRKVTERPEAIGQSTILIDSPERLTEIFEKYVKCGPGWQN
jgi:UDP-N-acetylglucosamine 2-epimerase (non-hydrolysing)